ncbi:MAG: AAA family ATPase [Methylotenera sp.]|nr:AAA family ATPase [Methylotenera sp.]MDP1755784.1 AAA family ATPase [Methylotenera sp.]MDP1958801.1 AAA family ATPase [Methylotenera sp.]MDP3302622.1 AAA family ATPase [Methylotenera sp.]MDP3943374.1 AAA family ATPase [Methylotenera sp.]
MYYPHFGLKQPPFKITPNTDFFFSGGNRGAVLDALVYAITNGEGIIKVVGEVGSGKTMLCRMLQTILPEQIESIYLANPSVAPEDVLHAIAFELQLTLPKNADRLKVMQALQAHLLSRHAQGRQVVIFVEEAQGMPLATLEEIRLLSNLETKQDKLLQIVLFGQPELDDNLNQTHIRQLRERITHSFHLGPLQTKDIGEYLIFRLRAAGYHGPHLFSEAAIKKISKAAQGLVRRVNILADKALLAAFADNVFQVTPRHVSAAIQDSEFGVKAKPVKKLLLLGTLILIMLGVVGLAATIINNKYKSPSVNDSQERAESKLVKKAATLNVDATKVNANKVDVSPINTDVAKAPVVLGTQTAAIEVEKAVDAKQQLADQRFNATNSLLLTAPPETVTLQIKSLTSKSAIGTPEVGNLSLTDEPLNAELEKLSQQLEVDNIYLYHTRKSGEIYTVILYGAFAQREEALAALKGLPALIRNNHPYLRTFAGVKKDIEQD